MFILLKAFQVQILATRLTREKPQIKLRLDKQNKISQCTCCVYYNESYELPVI